MARSSRSPSPSFDITESAGYRPPNTASAPFQYNADRPYTPEHGSYADQGHEPSEPFDNDDNDSLELGHLVSGKHVSAHTREIYDGFNRGHDTGLRKQTLKELLSAYWTVEIVCCAFSSVLLAVIAIILAIFNGRAVPDWPFGITLGALVSILAVIMTFGLTIPIGAGLAQMKWLWYRSERPVADFGVIDEASRNAWGSLKMLLKRKAGFLGALGAILMILTLPIAPFVQQTIQYDTHLVNSTGIIATLPVAVRSHQQIDRGTSGNMDVDLVLKAAFMNGLLDYQAEPPTFKVPVTCTTGVCGWLPYQSLAVSSHCDDLTLELHNVLQTNETFPNGYYNISLPDGLSLNIEADLHGLPAMTIQFSEAQVSDYDALVVFETIAAPLVTADTAGDEVDSDGIDVNNYANASTIGPFAARCMLSLVVQPYTGIVASGAFVESPSAPAETLRPYSKHIYWNESTDVWTMDSNDTSDLVTLNDTAPYGMDFNFFHNVQTYLQGQFSGSFQTTDAVDAVNQISSDVLHATFHALTRAEPHTLDAMMANVAASLTRSIRTAPGTSIAVNGTTWASSSMVHVEWAWLALPGALVLLVGAFVALVGLNSRRAGLREPWKGSTTAVLFHGLDLARDDEDDWRRVTRLAAVREMDAAAKDLRVALRRHESRDEAKGEDAEEGWGLRRVAI